MGGIKDGEIEEAPKNRNWVNDKTKSIVLDHGEVYILAKFITPVDWDPVTGLMQSGKDGQMDKSMQSAFTGFYKVLTVSHDFEGGKFTQKLNCIRVLGDQYDSGDVQVADAAKNTGARETPAAKKADDNPVSRVEAQVSSAVKSIPGSAGDAVATLASSGTKSLKEAGEFINVSGEDPFETARQAAEDNYLEPVNVDEEAFAYPDGEEEKAVQDDDADLFYADTFSGLEEDLVEAEEVSINEYGEEL
jgi:hypothetical protein